MAKEKDEPKVISTESGIKSAHEGENVYADDLVMVTYEKGPRKGKSKEMHRILAENLAKKGLVSIGDDVPKPEKKGPPIK